MKTPNQKMQFSIAHFIEISIFVSSILHEQTTAKARSKLVG